MADFILWRMDKKAQELKLTAVQKEKYEVIKENLKTHFAESLRDRQKMKDRFQKEMSKEDPNVKDTGGVPENQDKGPLRFRESKPGSAGGVL